MKTHRALPFFRWRSPARPWGSPAAVVAHAHAARALGQALRARAPADPIMKPGHGLAARHREHVLVVREAARGANTAQGGGCGCRLNPRACAAVTGLWQRVWVGRVRRSPAASARRWRRQGDRTAREPRRGLYHPTMAAASRPTARRCWCARASPTRYAVGLTTSTSGEQRLDRRGHHRQPFWRDAQRPTTSARRLRLYRDALMSLACTAATSPTTGRQRQPRRRPGGLRQHDHRGVGFQCGASTRS